MDACGTEREGLQRRTEPKTRYLDASGTGAWSAVADHIIGGPEDGSSVMYDEGKVIVMGGGETPTNTAEIIDLNAPTPP